MNHGLERRTGFSGAIKKPGALHKSLGVPKGEKIPAAKLKSAAAKGARKGSARVLPKR